MYIMGSTSIVINRTDLPLNTTVPILVDNAAVNNNQFFSTDASTTGAGSSAFQVFSTGGAQFWTPTGTGNEWIRVNYPYQVINRGFLFQCRGASLTDHHVGCKVQASNDGVDWDTLVTIPDNYMQSTALRTITFPNNKIYAQYRLFITSTIGNVANLGFFNLQYAGYVLF